MPRRPKQMANLPPLGSRGSEDKAQIYTIAASRAIAAAFPQIRTIGMWRPPDGYNEHSSGMAADVMIPDWNTPQGKTLGDQICAYALTLQGVDYVIWRQAMHYRGGRVTGMSDRGNPTQNHMDHNHVHTTGGGYPGPGQVYPAPGTPSSTVGQRFWPLGEGRIVTSPFGPRSGGFHAGVDFGRNGGSAGMPVYACQGGTVIKSGAASGYGGPDPAGWLVIDHSDADGSGCTEYGHIIREVADGQRVEAGQRIGRINPDQGTNGGVPPHLHLSLMPREYNPGAKMDPLPWLSGAREPGGAPPPPPPQPSEDGALVLSKAMGGSVSLERYRELLPGFRDCVLRCDAATPKRINMLVAQLGHECVGFKYMREIWGPTPQQLTYQGRMGNNNPGDGERYMGRGAIMITGKDNYRNLSKWAHEKGYAPTPTYFVDNPTELETPKYCFLGAIWYWTIARPKINEYCDWDDLEASLLAVTKAINGGTYGLDDRRNRLNRARSMDLAPIMRGGTPPTQGEDELSAEAERMIREMYGEWRKEKRGPSRSFLAEDGRDIESPLGFIYNIDGNVWTQQLTWAYLFDVPLAIEVVEAVARNGSYSGSWVASNAFNAWLNEFGQAYCQGLVDFKKALVSKLALSAQPQPVGSVVYRDTPAPVVDTRALEAEIARLSEQFELLRISVNNQPTASALPVSTEVAAYEDTTGDKIQRAVDSNMDYTDHVLGMDAAKRTALTRALQAINPMNGEQA